MPDQQDSRIEQQIGEYRLVRKLGSGSFGIVYLAEHVHGRTQAAVKVLNIQGEDLKNFINEARTIRLPSMRLRWICSSVSLWISQKRVKHER